MQALSAGKHAFLMNKAGSLADRDSLLLMESGHSEKKIEAGFVLFPLVLISYISLSLT